MDRLIVTGRENTKASVIDRRIRIDPGDPLSQAEMVDSQRRLYNLGIFNQVDMAVQNPEGIEPLKNVLFNLAEAPRWTFRYGGGIEFATGNTPQINNPQGQASVSPNGVLEITRLNMFGRDQTLSMRARFGLLTRRALISYDAPRLFKRENWHFTLSAFYDNTVNVNTFTSQRLEGSVGAEQRYSRATTLIYRMSYQRVSIDPNSLVIDPNLIPLYSRPVRIAMPSFTWVRDTRDNPVDTHKGTYNLLDLGLATSALGSQSNFGKILFQNSTYYTFKKRVGVCAQYDHRHRAPLWHQLLSRRVADGDSSAGAVFLRRRQLTAQVSPSTRQARVTWRPAIRLADRDCSSTTWKSALRRCCCLTSATI